MLLFSEMFSMCCVSHSIVSDSLRPRGLQPARLLCPWDSPSKNTGVGCHSLLQRIFLTASCTVGRFFTLRHQGSPCLLCAQLKMSQMVLNEIAHGVFCLFKELPWQLSSKESACSAEDLGLIPELERSPGGVYGNPLQYSCLENPMNREVWRATVRRVTKSWIQLKWLSLHACMGFIKLQVVTHQWVIGQYSGSKKLFKDSLVVQGLGFCILTAKSLHSVPGWGTKILKVKWQSQK